MSWVVAILGLSLTLGACSPRARDEGARQSPGENQVAPASVTRCDAYDEARAMAALDPHSARVKLTEALAEHSPGSRCRARMVGLLAALESAGPAPSELVTRGRPPAPSEREAAPAPEPAERPAPRPVVVVLDPGHGGDEFGATSGGIRESRLALDIAKRTARIVQSRQPEIEVRLTRDADRRVSLEQRTAMANAVDATAFVSIHLNDAEGEVRRGGVTTFVLDTTRDEQAIRLAARENGTTAQEVSQLSVLLATIERKTQLEASKRLAARVHRETLRGAREHLPRIADRGTRAALFEVLVGAKMPAILVEASFMNVPGEREALRTPRYREALARGIAQGILTYLFEEA